MSMRLPPLLIIFFLALLLPHQVLAHAQLHSAEPTGRAILDAPPTEVILTFNEPIAPLRARWFQPDGRAQDVLGWAQGPDLIVTVPSDLAPGTHALSWRIVSDDGHPVGGTHVFSIGFETGSPVAVRESVAWFAALARGAMTLTLVLGVGGMVWGVLSRVPAPELIRWALWAVPPASLLLMAAQAVDMMGVGAGALTDPAAWVLALTSPFALVAGLALIASALAATRRKSLVIVAWMLASMTFASAGHAARAEPVALMAVLMFGHAAALIFWAGALPGLLSSLRAPDAAQVMMRFSLFAMPMVALLVLTGAALAWRQVETPAALTGSAYGGLLTAKLALVAVVLALAARHRMILTPQLVNNPEVARPVFVRSLRIELLLMVAILALTAGFRLTPPPRALVDLPETRAELHLHGRQAMADIVLIPGRPGPNQVEIVVRDGDFQPLTPLEVTIFFSRPTEGLERIELHTERDEDGIWRAGPVHLPPGGPVDVVADILITDFRKEMIGGDIQLLPIPHGLSSSGVVPAP
jgi:copper transport protein